MKLRMGVWAATCLAITSSFGQTKNSPVVIAFGSCNDQARPQEMWQEIIDQHPDIWIWGGDNIYSDFTNPASRKALYQKQKGDPGYQKLIQHCVVTGTWDDHDYGVNDGGKNYTLKKESQQLAMEFIGFSKHHPVRHQTGIYNSMEYGKGHRKVKIINLDTRSFRDTVYRVSYIDSVTQKKMNRFEQNPMGDVLGETQWAWLQKQLQETTAGVIILNSSIQVLPTEHRFEKWSNFPAARARLLALVSQSNKHVIIISGDRHIAEFSKTTLANGKALYEFTSSGMTHTWSERWEEHNSLRIGELIVEKNYGIISIEWVNNQPQITLQSRGLDRQVFNEIKVSW